MKTTVVHHSADFDGIFCREIARKFLPDAELIGWDFPDKPLSFPSSGKIYVLDLPIDRVFGFETETLKKIERGIFVWIDHHKSSIETHPTDIPGYRIDGVAACRLAWFWFSAWEKFKSQTSLDPDEPWFNAHYPFATKSDFVDRKLEEPLAVRLAGEYDIWDKRDPRAEVFQFGIRSVELNDNLWSVLLNEWRPTVTELESLMTAGRKFALNPDGTATHPFVLELLKDGEMLQRYQQRNDEGVIKRSFLVKFEGFKFLALNTARCNSLTFASKDVPETGHDALMGFYWNGKWNVSLYHAKHRTDLDLSKIAVKYGGGGHRGACGFQTDKMPII